MVQVISRVPEPTQWSEGTKALGQSLGESYMHQADEQAVRQAIEQLGPNPKPRDILTALTGARTHGPEAKQRALSNYLGVEQFEELKRKAQKQEEQNSIKNLLNLNKNTAHVGLEERKIGVAESKAVAQKDIEGKKIKIAEEKNEIARQKLAEREEKDKIDQERKAFLVDQMDNLTPEQKEATKRGSTLSSVERMYEQYVNPKENSFEKREAALQAEKVSRLEKELDEVSHSRGLQKEVLDIADKRTSLGYLSGLTGWDADMTKMIDLSYASLKPLVTLFAPVGAIAVSKLNSVIDKFQVKKGDTQDIIKAKVSAAQSFMNQVESVNRRRIAEIRAKNTGRIKESESNRNLEQLEKEKEDLLNIFSEINTDIPVGLPSAEKLKGKTITSPTGKKFYSDGEKWTAK